MMAIYLFAFIIIIGTFPKVESGVYSHGPRQNYQTENQNNYYGGASANYKTNQKLTGTIASTNASHPLSGRKLSVSAWGIIAIILGVIILSTITYYIFILYPYICKKDQTYDIIELTEVNSVCTVSDNANNMPLYRSANDVSNDVSLNR